MSLDFMELSGTLWGIELTCRFSLRGKSRSHSTNRNIRYTMIFPLNLKMVVRQFLVEQLTLSQPGGQIMPTTIHTKGQLISKAIYGLLTSPKKRTEKFVRSFFGRIYGSPICCLKLTDL